MARAREPGAPYPDFFGLAPSTHRDPGPTSRRETRRRRRGRRQPYPRYLRGAHAATATTITGLPVLFPVAVATAAEQLTLTTIRRCLVLCALPPARPAHQPARLHPARRPPLRARTRRRALGGARTRTSPRPNTLSRLSSAGGATVKALLSYYYPNRMNPRRPLIG